MTWILAVVAALIAAFMALLIRGGVDPDLRSAVRTTAIVAAGWGFAWASYRPVSFNLLPRTWILFGLSALAVGLSWLLYFRSLGCTEKSMPTAMDRLNVPFAVVFALTLIGGQLDQQKVVSSLGIILGALILAQRRG
jgi:transporter family protein